MNVLEERLEALTALEGNNEDVVTGILGARAIFSEQPPAAQALAERDDQGRSLLHHAAMHGQAKHVQRLLAREPGLLNLVDVHGHTALVWERDASASHGATKISSPAGKVSHVHTGCRSPCPQGMPVPLAR